MSQKEGNVPKFNISMLSFLRRMEASEDHEIRAVAVGYREPLELVGA